MRSDRDHDRVFVRLRLFERRELAVEQRGWHEVPVACRQPARDQVSLAFEIDDLDVGALADQDIAIGALERRASHGARCIFSMLDGGWNQSPSSKIQLSRCASINAIVLLPEPDTPITTTTEGLSRDEAVCLSEPRVWRKPRDGERRGRDLAADVRFLWRFIMRVRLIVDPHPNERSTLAGDSIPRTLPLCSGRSRKISHHPSRWQARLLLSYSAPPSPR